MKKKTIEQLDIEIQKLQTERNELFRQELAKQNLNENRCAIICLWCNELPTMDDTSNICNSCFDEHKKYTNTAGNGNVLKIYDTV